MDQTRRWFLGSLPAVALGLAGCNTTDQAEQSPSGRVESVGLETLTTGVETPLGIVFPEGDRRYIADRSGVIHVHEGGSLRDEPLLDLRDTVELGGERGLLGIALHPEFPTDRRLFVRYSGSLRPEMPDDYSHTFVLAEYTVSADGRRVRRDSQRVLLEIAEPQSNHNAGDLAFGPDGYLYVPVGDGGGGGDRGRGHVDDWYDENPGGNGQDVTENLLGSILRLDVDGSDGDRAYAIPDDNPLVGRPGRDEQYAWGFRNPWRLSFDGADCFVGDVGQSAWEEVDLLVAGGNYGWNVREGRHCYQAQTCPDRTPEGVRGGEKLIEPIIEYPHSGAPVSGISVIGGAVYRGDALPELDGTYVFGDLNAGGQLFAATAEAGEWTARLLDVEDGDKLRQLLAVGRDPSGDLYVLGRGTNGGGVHRIRPA